MYKIILVAIVSAILIIYLREIGSNLALPSLIISGIIITILSLDYISDFYILINSLMDNVSIDKSFFSIIFKVIGIGYIVDLMSNIIDDFGLKSLSVKLNFAGRLIILAVAMPIFLEFFNLICSLI